MIKLSRNKALLLRLFYSNPDREYFMQEIGRILDKKPGVFQRTLCDMEREGILISVYRANARYFRANKDYSLYEEYKSIIFKTVGIMGSLKEILEKARRIDFAFLYGSFAKGEENYLSDIDLVIIGSPDEMEIIRDFEKLEKNLSREINYRLFTSTEFVNGIRQKDAFLLTILNEQKIMLVGEINDLRQIGKGPSHKEAKPRSPTDKKSVKKS